MTVNPLKDHNTKSTTPRTITSELGSKTDSTDTNNSAANLKSSIIHFFTTNVTSIGTINKLFSSEDMHSINSEKLINKSAQLNNREVETIDNYLPVPTESVTVKIIKRPNNSTDSRQLPSHNIFQSLERERGGKVSLNNRKKNIFGGAAETLGKQFKWGDRKSRLLASDKKENVPFSSTHDSTSESIRQVPVRSMRKPLAQLSPNATYVRVLSRQVSTTRQPIIAHERLSQSRLRPLPRRKPKIQERHMFKMSKNTPPNTTKTATSTKLSTTTKQPLRTSSIHPFLKGNTRRIHNKNIVKEQEENIVATPEVLFPKPNRSNENKNKATISNAEAKNQREPARLTTTLRIRPSFRLTSRLSSDTPRATIQSLSDKGIFKKRQKFSSSSSQRNFDDQPKVPFNPNRMEPKGIRILDALTNFKREPLTESPERVVITTEGSEGSRDNTLGNYSNISQFQNSSKTEPSCNEKLEVDEKKSQTA